MGKELCSRSGAARLSLGLGLGILALGEKKREKEACSVRDGGRTKCSARPPTWLREGAGFLPLSLRVGSPVVLRGLRCHVCCDSALGFRKTLCRIAWTSPTPSRLLAERFGKKEKRRKKKREKRVRGEE